MQGRRWVWRRGQVYGVREQELPAARLACKDGGGYRREALVDGVREQELSAARVI